MPALQFSDKDLGDLAMKSSGPCSFWNSRRGALPWQIFPVILSPIDSYSKKVLHEQFDQSWMPGWLAPLDHLWTCKGPTDCG